MPTRKQPPAARARSGWVSEDARSTVQFKIRCAPELAERARRVAEARGRTLAEVLESGVRREEEDLETERDLKTRYG